MRHRHLDDPGYSLTSIDDVIERGNLQDWIELAEAADSSGAVLEGIQTIVAAEPASSPLTVTTFGASTYRKSAARIRTEAKARERASRMGASIASSLFRAMRAKVGERGS